LPPAPPRRPDGQLDRHATEPSSRFPESVVDCPATQDRDLVGMLFKIAESPGTLRSFLGKGMDRVHDSTFFSVFAA